MKSALVAFLLSLATAATAALAGDPSTAIIATPLHDAFAVPADDGKIHVEYDLLVTNVFDAPIALRSIDVTDAAGKVLMRIDGKTLAAATPNARMIVVPGAGHMIMAEAPDELLAALQQ